jgi:hypothetical protein
MGLLDIIILILVISWLGGFSLGIGGGLIHLLLVVAVVVIVARVIGVS